MHIVINKWLAKIGLAGVASDEKPIAQQLENTFRIAIITFIIAIPVLWYFDQQTSRVTGDWVTLFSWMIWLALIVETIVLSFVVKDFKAYLKSNWMIFPVLVLTFPMILGEIPYAVLIRAVQVLMLARALHSTVQSTRKIFQRSHLGAIILGYLFVIIVAGIAIHSIDPNVKSVEDGLWWAIVTMATLGYGDVVPTSTEGRLFASIIIVLGAVFFSLLTAQIAAYMVGEEEAHREIEILRITRENNARLEKMTFREDEKVISAIHALNARLDHIEKMLEQKLKDSAS